MSNTATILLMYIIGLIAGFGLGLFFAGLWRDRRL